MKKALKCNYNTRKRLVVATFKKEASGSTHRSKNYKFSTLLLHLFCCIMKGLALLEQWVKGEVVRLPKVIQLLTVEEKKESQVPFLSSKSISLFLKLPHFRINFITKCKACLIQ